MKFRHELKYLINEADAQLLRGRLDAVMQKDKHVKGGEYSIKSLYFDDYWQTAYNEKLMGISDRKKYRIRLYNNDDSFIRLECKLKKEQYIAKTSAPLTSSEAQSILDGDYAFLLGRKERLCQQFYVECMSNVMRPYVYVEYEREPYVYEYGDVRITFDKNVRGAPPTHCLTDELPYQYVLPPGKLVLEVKFTEFLPQFVREVLPLRAAELTAVSKYTLCCDKINYLNTRESE